jgi:hypothetical protein
MNTDHNPYHDPKNGRFTQGNAPKNSLQNGEESGTLSATGENPSIPEMTANAVRKHTKHLQTGKSYPGMSVAEYKRKGVELARKPVGGNIDGYKGTDGCIVRYDKVNNDFVKAYHTGVATFFKPSGKEKYFRNKMKEDGGVQDE